MPELTDNSIPNNRHCSLCGRYFDMNEVRIGVYTDYYLLHQTDCPCPTCFGHQLHRVQDPSMNDVLNVQKFCDIQPSAIIGRASVWRRPAVRRKADRAD